MIITSQQNTVIQSNL